MPSDLTPERPYILDDRYRLSDELYRDEDGCWYRATLADATDAAVSAQQWLVHRLAADGTPDQLCKVAATVRDNLQAAASETLLSPERIVQDSNGCYALYTLPHGELLREYIRQRYPAGMMLAQALPIIQRLQHAAEQIDQLGLSRSLLRSHRVYIGGDGSLLIPALTVGAHRPEHNHELATTSYYLLSGQSWQPQAARIKSLNEPQWRVLSERCQALDDTDLPARLRALQNQDQSTMLKLFAAACLCFLALYLWTPDQPEAPATPEPSPRTETVKAPLMRWSGPAQLSLTAPNQTFYPGMKFWFYVQSDSNGYLHCYHQQNQTIVRIFPNRYRNSSRLTSSQRLEIPDMVQQHQFDLILGNKGQAETFLCLLAPRDLAGELPETIWRTAFEPLGKLSVDDIVDQYLALEPATVARQLTLDPAPPAGNG